MDDASTSPRGAGDPVFGIRERTVQRALTEKHPVIGEAYRRLFVLSRSDAGQDPLAPLLAMHLCRELMNTLPGQWDVPGNGHVDYANPMTDAANAWPKAKNGTRGRMPDAAREILVRLLVEHEASGSRPDRFEAFLRNAAPARTRAVPGHLTTSWKAVHKRALGVTHGLMAVPPSLPDATEAREVVDGLTDILYGTFAGHFAVAGEVADLINLADPQPADVDRLVGVLVTPTHARDFYERASLGWFPVLVADRRFYQPPGVAVAVEGGYIAPIWPEGTLLLRAAARHPDEVLVVLDRMRGNRNQYVLSRLPEVLAAIPIERAAHWIRRRGWPNADQVISTNVDDIGVLAARIVNEVDPEVGFGLLGRLIAPLWAQRRETMSDFLLAKAFEQIETQVDDAHRARSVSFLRSTAEKQLRDSTQTRSDLSTMWLPSFEEKPDLALDGDPWRVMQLLYREAKRLPAPAFAEFTAQMRRRRAWPFKRLAVALTTARPADDPEGVDTVLSDPEAWGSQRRPTTEEFRALVASAFGLLGPEPRRTLVDWVADAAEIRQRYDDAFTGASGDPDRDEMVLGWRSLFLGAVAGQLTPDEIAKVGNLRRAERVRRRRFGLEREPSPMSTEAMVELGTAGTLSFLATWEPPRTFLGPDESAVAAELKGAVLRDPSTWIEAIVADERELRPVYAYQVLQAAKETIEAGERPIDTAALVRFLSRSMGDRATSDRESVDSTDRAVLSVIEAATQHATDQVIGAVDAFASILIEMIGRPDAPRVLVSADGEEDLLTEILNNTPAVAIAVAARLVYTLGERGLRHGALVDALVRRASTERSRVISASFGRAMAWLLTTPNLSPNPFPAILIDPGDEDALLAFETYLLSWNPLDAVVRATADLYARTAREVGVRRAGPRRRFDFRERLGEHLVVINLRQTVPEGDAWLRAFYESAPDNVLRDTTRFLADHLAFEDLSDNLRDRLIDMLAERATISGPEESEGLGWASRTARRHVDVLVRILKPAAVRRVETGDESGILRLLARDDPAYECRDVATVLRGIVEADRWEALPHLAPDELRIVLRRLARSDDPSCREAARAVIDWFGARGYTDYGGLLDDPG